MKRKGLVDAVGPMRENREAWKLAEWYVKHRHPEHGEQWVDVWPKEARMFVVAVGAGCEPLRGLCRYPATRWHLGGERRTRLDNGW